MEQHLVDVTYPDPECMEVVSYHRHQPYLSQAQSVATETMRRVRRNCERIISRLQKLGFIFGTFPDGTRRSYRVAPLTPPSDRMRADRE